MPRDDAEGAIYFFKVQSNAASDRSEGMHT